MEWNQLLLWISGTSCVVTLIRLLKSPVKQVGWIAVSTVVMVVVAAALVVVPDIAGYIGGAAWALFLLLPSLLFRKIVRASAAMEFSKAAALASIARWLHPMDGWWHQPRMFRGYAAVQHGENGDALRLFEPLRRLRPPVGLGAEIQVRRLNHDWAGVIDLVNQTPDPSHRRAGQILPTYLRALGELGHADAMVITYIQERRALHAEGMAVANANALWMILAFTGRTATMEDLLNHHFPHTPPLMRRLWRARSEVAAGRQDVAIPELKSLATQPTGREGGVAIEALYLLDHLPPPLHLLPGNQHLLEQIDHEVRHEAAYTVAMTGVRKVAVVTWILLAANCAMYIVELVHGASRLADSSNPADEQKLTELYVHLGAAVTAPGVPTQWWRAITANFLHFGFAHLLMNMLALRALGPFIEQFLGRWRYLVLYFAAGVGAVAGVMALQEAGIMQRGFLVGASGAIMGLIGANGAILLKGWLRDRAAIAARRLRTVLFIVAVQVVFDQLTPQVSGTAHLLGLGIGFVVTLLLMIRTRR